MGSVHHGWTRLIVLAGGMHGWPSLRARPAPELATHTNDVGVAELEQCIPVNARDSGSRRKGSLTTPTAGGGSNGGNHGPKAEPPAAPLGRRTERPRRGSIASSTRGPRQSSHSEPSGKHAGRRGARRRPRGRQHTAEGWQHRRRGQEEWGKLELPREDQTGGGTSSSRKARGRSSDQRRGGRHLQAALADLAQARRPRQRRRQHGWGTQQEGLRARKKQQQACQKLRRACRRRRWHGAQA